MYTNIWEQTKEIAVLRAMGIGRCTHAARIFEPFALHRSPVCARALARPPTLGAVIRIYVYEAFVLSVAAASLGIVMGSVLGAERIVPRAVAPATD